jgi:opacity protein-like surface antigen
VRVFVCLFTLFLPLFAYKDSFYVGGYGGLFNEESSGDRRVEFEGAKSLYGIRFGWNNNTPSSFYRKNRIEISADQRSFAVGDETRSGWHAGVSFALGYNLDLLLTHEIVPFVSIGAGLGKFDTQDNGSEIALGIGIAYATRYVECAIEAKREFWQLQGFRFPFSAPFEGDFSVDTVTAGINFRF